MEMNFENLDMQKWNIPTDKAQRVDEKNGVIRLVILFTPRVMIKKCQKWFFFVYSATDSKN